MKGKKERGRVIVFHPPPKEGKEGNGEAGGRHFPPFSFFSLRGPTRFGIVHARWRWNPRRFKIVSLAIGPLVGFSAGFHPWPKCAGKRWRNKWKFGKKMCSSPLAHLRFPEFTFSHDLFVYRLTWGKNKKRNKEKYIQRVKLVFLSSLSIPIGVSNRGSGIFFYSLFEKKLTSAVGIGGGKNSDLCSIIAWSKDKERR